MENLNFIDKISSIKYCIDIIQREVKEDLKLILQLLYIMLSAIQNDPRNLAINAPPGEGKSYNLNKVGDMFPKGDILFVSHMSEKALFHRKGILVIKNEQGEYLPIEDKIKEFDEQIENKEEENKDRGFTTDEIIDIINGDSRLICLSISDPYKIKELAINISREMLRKRKRQFKVRPYVLFVFDEAQEFVPDLSNSRGVDKECSQEIETLLRQGRKYGLGECIATQRIAYLNTSALQQLHTYFVGTCLDHMIGM